MQKTPQFVKAGWRVQFNPQNVFKTKNMGWTFIDDGNSFCPQEFATLEEAIAVCQEMGLLTRSHLHGRLPALPVLQSEELFRQLLMEGLPKDRP